MENCPFCDAEVSEELIRFGGACPTCFNAIPGEEAPTDPGISTATVTSAGPASSENSKFPLIPALLAGLLVVAFGLFFLVNVDPDPVEAVVVTEADAALEAQASIIEENTRALAENEEAEAEAEAAAEAELLEEQARLAQQAALEAAARQTAAAQAAEAASGPTDYVDRTPEASVVGFITETTPDDSYRDPSTYISRSEPSVVTGASAIRRAIRGVISDNSGAAEFCYTQQNDRSLGGTWSVSFIVNEDGSTGEITVTGQGVSNEGLERCLRGKVHRWVFPAIAESTPYSKDYNFTPAL